LELDAGIGQGLLERAPEAVEFHRPRERRFREQLAPGTHVIKP